VLGERVTPRRVVLDLRAVAPVWRIPAAIEQRIVAAAPSDWEVIVVPTDTVSDGDGGHAPSPELLAAMASAEVYFGFGITVPLFAAAPQLKWVQSATAGVGSALFPALRESAVLLTNSAGIHAIPMAEYVIAGLLHFWRGLDVALAQQPRAAWDRAFYIAADTPIREVGESTVLIIGAGGIGSALATRLSALGATCVGVRRRPEAGVPAGFARVVGPEGLEAELRAADAVVLAAPGTPGTKQILSAARLDLLPRHAVVVNVGRGSTLDTAALAERLADGRLRGAALDVFDPEPLAADSPLWQLRQALLTPHVSAVTVHRFWEREAALFVENWSRYRAGETLTNLVDKDAGY
jgi:phosphoglycerate dehydrogenase-like enzyme